MQGFGMLGYVTTTEHGAGDELLLSVAEVLQSRGWRLAGAVQINTETGTDRACDMDLLVLDGVQTIRISQNLGSLSRGCRLDAAALETAVGLVEKTMDAGVHLLIVNKFGKQEADGRGFRPLIGRALTEGVPVLTAVAATKREAFDSFAAGVGAELPYDIETVLAWCQAVCPLPAAGTN